MGRQTRLLPRAGREAGVLPDITPGQGVGVQRPVDPGLGGGGPAPPHSVPQPSYPASGGGGPVEQGQEALDPRAGGGYSSLGETPQGDTAGPQGPQAATDTGLRQRRSPTVQRTGG